MPKKIVTSLDIFRRLFDSKKNRKPSRFDTGNLGARLKRLNDPGAGENPVIKKNEHTSTESLLVSNREEVETDLTHKADREYYSKVSFESTFDTEVVQLKTAAPPEEKDPTPPPPPPTGLQISCTNYCWSMDGKKGRTIKDQPAWHKNDHPMGNNPGGGYLVIPDDHPLFYIKKLEPINQRASFNYEWKVGDEVVGTRPFFHMFNCSNQGKTDQWHIDNDRAWHTHWDQQEDIIVSVRVWNESGQVTAKAPYRCAGNVGYMDHRNSEGQFKPKWKWHGTRYFNEKNFFAGRGMIGPLVLGKAFQPREIHLAVIEIEDFNKHTSLSPSKFAVKPWTDKQLLRNVQRPEKDDPAYKHHAKNWTEFKDNNDEVCPNPWNRDQKVMVGQLYINGKWIDFKDIWSGYKVSNPYDLKNFMRLKKENRKLVNGKWPEQTTVMASVGNRVSVMANMDEKVKFGFKFGYRYSSDHAKSNVKYMWFSDFHTHRVKESDKPHVWIHLKAKHQKIRFDDEVYDWRQINAPKKTTGKFTASTAVKSKSKTKKKGGN